MFVYSSLLLLLLLCDILKFWTDFNDIFVQVNQKKMTGVFGMEMQLMSCSLQWQKFDRLTIQNDL